jgi:hypothetical protein
MPQISLKVSKNIDTAQVDFRKLFIAIHDVLRDVPNLDVTTCHSGIIVATYLCQFLFQGELVKHLFDSQCYLIG